MSVRKLPKKRKFDPSELEEMDKQTSDIHEGLQQQQQQQNANANIRNKSPIPVSVVHTQVSNNVHQSVVIVPPQSAAVDYSFREGIDCTMSSQLSHHHKYMEVLNSSTGSAGSNISRVDESHQQQQQQQQVIPTDMSNCLSVINSNIITSSNGPRKHNLPPNSTGRSDTGIDLNEWRDHRVLAKQNNVYLPGVIRKAGIAGEVWVELDCCEGKQVKFTNVLTTGKYDIIGDASPSMGQLTLGCRVCVRKCTNLGDHMNTNVFVEGVVYNIYNNPTRFVVNVNVNSDDRHNCEEIIVKRADLRLMQPPWWDELADLNNDTTASAVAAASVSVTLNGQHFTTEDNGYGVVMQPGLLHEPSGVSGIPLQLHQVVPTLQPTGNELYRSAATSPLPHLATPVSHNSTCTPLSNGSADELRRRQYDDFCESDDELRREDILFLPDAGV